MEWVEGTRTLTTDPAALDRHLTYTFLSEEAFWSLRMPRDVFDTAIDNALCFTLLVDGTQVGFARVITDHATFAYLADVFVLEPFRDQGLSKWMMEKLLEHPDLQNLRRILLATLDTHGLYEQYGFKPLPNPEWFMELLKTPFPPPTKDTHT